jgi:hypothetical protein
MPIYLLLLELFLLCPEQSRFLAFSGSRDFQLETFEKGCLLLDFLQENQQRVNACDEV